MSVVLNGLPSHAMHTAEGVLAQVNTLADRLRARAPETERLRRMHPPTSAANRRFLPLRAGFCHSTQEA